MQRIITRSQQCIDSTGLGSHDDVTCTACVFLLDLVAFTLHRTRDG